MYALIEFAGKQFRVEEGSSIKVPFVEGKIGSKVVLDKILYLDDGQKITVGTPLVSGKNLNGEIVSHVRGNKVIVFKFKRRKGYQKKNTHRQNYTILKIGKLGAVNKKDVSTTAKTSKSKNTVKKREHEKKATPKTAAKKTTVKKTSSSKKETE